DRVVGNDSAVVVLPRDVLCSRDCHYPRCRRNGRQIHAPYATACDAADAESSMQHVCGQAQVVAVRRGAAHVQPRAFMRRAHGATSVVRKGGGGCAPCSSWKRRSKFAATLKRYALLARRSSKGLKSWDSAAAAA